MRYLSKNEDVLVFNWNIKDMKINYIIKYIMC